jgi:hypothetical protein
MYIAARCRLWHTLFIAPFSKVLSLCCATQPQLLVTLPQLTVDSPSCCVMHAGCLQLPVISWCPLQRRRMNTPCKSSFSAAA